MPNYGGRAVHHLTRLILTILLVALPQVASAQQGENWVVSWVGSAQGPYPVGNPVAKTGPEICLPFPLSWGE
jgi:hypothetical protein